VTEGSFSRVLDPYEPMPNNKKVMPQQQDRGPEDPLHKLSSFAQQQDVAENEALAQLLRENNCQKKKMLEDAPATQKGNQAT
jgi:hypothetical protein